MKRILIFSLVVNLTLLAMTAWRNPHQVTLPVREIRSEIQSTQSAFKQRQAPTGAQSKTLTPWSTIENRDIRAFIANLRAIGCPEATIRDIVTLRVCRAYRERALQLETELVLKQASNPYLDYSEWQILNDKKQDLRDEMKTEFESVLGEDWGTLASSLTGFPFGSDGLNKILPAEKRAQLREIDKQFRHDLDELQHKQMTGGLEKDEVATLQGLERQKRDALAAVLSPQEMEEYLYRNSLAADYVRRNLPEAKSEAEYHTMVKLALDMEMSPTLDSVQQRYMLNNGEADLEGQQRREEYARRLKELLGEDRIAEQQAEEKARADTEAKEREEQDKQRMQQQLVDVAADFGVSTESANLFFNRLKESEPVLKKIFDEMEKNFTGTPEEKQKQMEAAFKAELNGMAIETMGDKGPAVVEKLIKH